MVRPSFRSVLVVCGAAVGMLAAGTPAAGAATAGSAARAATTPAVNVSRPLCTSSLEDPASRAAMFTVRASRGSSATGFGFTAALQEKPAGGAWTTLSGAASPEGLGTFQPATEGAAAMIRRINVRGLRMGSAYRLKVTFRWVTPTGRLRVTKRSGPCTVKELRPNLGVIRSLGWIPGTRGDQVVHRVQLRVARTASLAGSRISLSVSQGTMLLGRVDPPLAHGALVLIPGTVCTPGRPVTFRIEVDPAIEESSATDNELTAPCVPGQAFSR